MPHLDWDGGMLRWRLDLTVRPPPQVDPRLEAHGQPRPHPPQHRRPGHDQRVGVDPDGPRDASCLNPKPVSSWRNEHRGSGRTPQAHSCLAGALALRVLFVWEAVKFSIDGKSGVRTPPDRPRVQLAWLATRSTRNRFPARETPALVRANIVHFCGCHKPTHLAPTHARGAPGAPDPACPDPSYARPSGLPRLALQDEERVALLLHRARDLVEPRTARLRPQQCDTSVEQQRGGGVGRDPTDCPNSWGGDRYHPLRPPPPVPTGHVSSTPPY